MNVPVKISAGIFIMLFSAISILPTFAETQTSTTEIIPINETLGLEKTVLEMNISSNNELPWGFVEGKIANAATNYPVIIQIYKGDEAFHFAQTSVNEDGSYEYKFRVLNVNSEKTLKLFEGDYTVKIFKVVNLHSGLNSV